MSDSLHSFIEKLTGESHLRVEQDLGDGFVRLRSEEAERRQAKHDIRKSEDIVIEMLRNSRDAQAKRIFVATWKDGEVRNITIIDDGSGIPESMLSRIFEARVTSKLDTMCMDLWGVHGRGMALYAIKTNADNAQVLASKLGGGSSIHVEASTARLGEKRDQSSFPVFSKNDKGVVTVRGPKNINRTVMEFAYIERNACDVYFGSSAEIAASLWSQSKSRIARSTMVFCDDPAELPVCERLALASSPEEFARIAESLGLPMSSRTARRIMNGEIHPAINAYESISSPQGAHSQSDLVNAKAKKTDVDPVDLLTQGECPSVRLSDADRIRLIQALKEAYSDIAESYYLDSDVEMDIKVSKGKIHLSIPICAKQ